MRAPRQCRWSGRPDAVGLHTLHGPSIRFDRPIYVAYLIIDAVIDLQCTRKRNPDKSDAYFIKPADIADEVWHVAHQARSAWLFVTEIRSFGDMW
jgi:hypothetical protein